MKPETKILRDLAAGQTTADSLAPRCGMPTAAATVILDRMVKDGLVTSFPLAGIPSLLIYKLAPTESHECI